MHPQALFFVLVSDEVDLSVGFPAWPAGILGTPKPIRLAAPPTRSSYSVFLHHRLFFGSDLGDLPVGFPALSAGWWAYSAILLRLPRPIDLTVYDDRSQPNGRTKVSLNRYYTLILAKRPFNLYKACNGAVTQTLCLNKQPYDLLSLFIDLIEVSKQVICVNIFAYILIFFLFYRNFPQILVLFFQLEDFKTRLTIIQDFSDEYYLLIWILCKSSFFFLVTYNMIF